jgi:hypothetical protein
MNSRHRKTLTAIFAKPQTAPINWDDIEALLLAVGAALIEGPVHECVSCRAA